MNLIKIEGGLVELRLTPDDCIMLASVCQHALGSGAIMRDERSVNLVEAMQAAFNASAIASMYQMEHVGGQPCT